MYKYTSKDGAEMVLISEGLVAYWTPWKYNEKYNGLIIAM